MLILLLLKYQSYRSFLLLFSCSVVSDSLWPHWLQHARLPCPSPSPRACSDSCQLSWWCHPTILSSVVSFSSCPQSFPASGSFLMSRLFISGSQSIGASSSASVLPLNKQDWFPLGWTGWISLQSKGLSRVFFNTAVQKHQWFNTQPSYTRASLVAQRLKHLPAMQETWVQSLGREDPLEKKMATHSSILAWRIPWTEEPGGLQSMGSQKVGHDWVTLLTHSAFFMVQLSHPYMTTGKTISLTRWIFIGKVMSLIFICCLGFL